MATIYDNTKPSFEDIRREVSDRFDHDFNYIPLPLLEKAYPDGQLLEHIIYPEGYDFETEQLYPMWNTLFEARHQILSEKLIHNVNELAQIGIHLMQVDETFAMMFIAGAGYDFYESHFFPLYRDVLKWIK